MRYEEIKLVRVGNGPTLFRKIKGVSFCDMPFSEYLHFNPLYGDCSQVIFKELVEQGFRVFYGVK